MRTRLFISGGLCVLVISLVIVRWPRLATDMVSITRSEAQDDEMVVEYRMPRRFELGLAHGIRKPLVWPDGPGVHLGPSWTPLRKEAGVVIPSAYDWVRGEYYVHLLFRREAALVVDANGRRLEFTVWSAPDTRGVRWRPPGEHVRLGDGIGNDIVSLAMSADQHEYLMLYAGTDIKEFVR